MKKFIFAIIPLLCLSTTISPMMQRAAVRTLPKASKIVRRLHEFPRGLRNTEMMKVEEALKAAGAPQLIDHSFQATPDVDHAGRHAYPSLRRTSEKLDFKIPERFLSGEGQALLPGVLAHEIGHVEFENMESNQRRAVSFLSSFKTAPVMTLFSILPPGDNVGASRSEELVADLLAVARNPKTAESLINFLDKACVEQIDDIYESANKNLPGAIQWAKRTFAKATLKNVLLFKLNQFFRTIYHSSDWHRIKTARKAYEELYGKKDWSKSSTPKDTKSYQRLMHYREKLKNPESNALDFGKPVTE